ncbi:MAG: 30S ribosomal protein S1 [Rhodospirillaceae bacterium]|jgi:small subunit ribosomal protein S1|nr:30S ribosomal protein S1 [Rhodospirillaceae bacterium]MBT4464321.1 30S ribosomal protein S1 [Rhodospirillaceae bacterium]
MAPANTEQTPFDTGEVFADLLEESLGNSNSFQGSVVKGTIIALDDDAATIDVGLKSEGRVDIKEFTVPGQEPDIKIGDVIDIFVERFEDRDGVVRLSREKARREEAWTELEKQFEATERVNGVIFGRVKGGFIVDLSGAVAFLPGSQVDIRPVRDISPLMGTPQPFQILKMDRQRNNIVVSRRAVLEETRAEERGELISNLSEGQVLEGVVKNITDYGAFVDLGGVDGLLHVTDIAWRRINHPSDALQIGQTVKVQVIRFNAETQRISLGMKQLESDPWEGVKSKYPVDAKFTGRITNITDYGAFVELEPGVEGLVHVSEMSWTKKNIHPGKIVSTSQEVEVMVLDADPEKRRISLGLKQCNANPWEAFVDTFKVGTEVEGEVKNITEFGLFIGLDGEIDGMAHLSDLSWEKSGEEALADFSKGDMVKAKVLDVDVEKERISLGLKQLSEDPFASEMGSIKKGDTVTCTVTGITTGGIEVKVGDGLPGFIRKTDLSRERSEQRPDRYAAGEKVDAKVTQIDASGRKLTLSIKNLEAAEEKKAMKEYGSSDSGASLGDILGAALKEKQGSSDTDDTAEKKPAKKAAAKKAAPKKAAAKEDTADEADDKAEEKPAKKAAAKKPAAKKPAAKKAAPKKAAAKKAKDD